MGVAQSAITVLEVFSRIALGSPRPPFAFVSMTLENRKNGDLRSRPGLAPHVSTPFVGDNTITTGGIRMIDVPRADQPAPRTFLDAVAARERAGSWDAPAPSIRRVN